MDLFVSQFGTRIRRSGERIVLVNPKTGKKEQYPARNISKIIVLSPSSISSGAVGLALDFDIDVVFLGKHGMPVGRLFPSKRGSLTIIRQKQAEASGSQTATELAKKFIAAKVGGQIGFLRFLEKKCKIDLQTPLARMEAYIESLPHITGDIKTARPQLLAIEGNAAHQYFMCLQKLIRFPGRVTQNAKDSFNVLLNYGYGILYNEIERQCLYVGLDPYIGFYHSDRYGQISLVFDLIEEFRVPLIDCVVAGIMLKGADKADKLVNNGLLGKMGKKMLIDAVYSRMATEIEWQGRKMKARHAIREQVRHFARHLTGEDKEYTPFKWENYGIWKR